MERLVREALKSDSLHESNDLSSRRVADRLTIASVAERGLKYIVLADGTTDSPSDNIDKAMRKRRADVELNGPDLKRTRSDNGTPVPCSSKNEQKNRSEALVLGVTEPPK
eukprot:4004630-Amphidinium_carterae.1